jgi:hypothetical protein
MVKVPEYKFIEEISSDMDTCPIKILNGQFKDIIYRYGKISLKEENENVSVTMDITMVSCPKNFNQQDPEFTQTVGEIFVDIVEKNANTEKVESVDLEDDVHQD